MTPAEAIAQATARTSLTTADARAAMLAVLDDGFTPMQTAAWLRALAAKGETAVELRGCLAALMERALPVKHRAEAIDTAGTGGDRQSTFNASTAAALITAAAGGVVAKAGNRGVSSRCGSADLLAAVGITIDLAPEEVDTWLTEDGFAFLLTPRFHPALHRLAPLRRELGITSVFNLLGPLANPAAPSRRLLGTARAELMEVYAETLLAIGTTRALIVRGRDGLDEISVAAPTDIIEIQDGAVHRYTLEPEQLGVTRVALAAVRGGEPAENAALLRALCQGKPGPMRDFCVLNAAAALYLAGRAEDLESGAELARCTLTSGAVAALLDKLVARSLRTRPEADHDS